MKFKIVIASVLALILLLLLLAFSLFIFNNMKTESYITINNKKIIVEIAENQAKGLGNRPGLEQGRGMLFIYKDCQIRKFWMKDMKFNLDIIWLKDDKVVGLAENVPAPDPNEKPISVSSPPEVNYVLEVNAGFAEKNNIKINDQAGYHL